MNDNKPITILVWIIQHVIEMTKSIMPNAPFSWLGHYNFLKLEQMSFLIRVYTNHGHAFKALNNHVFYEIIYDETTFRK
jgi:hypothetical protein